MDHHKLPEGIIFSVEQIKEISQKDPHITRHFLPVNRILEKHGIPFSLFPLNLSQQFVPVELTEEFLQFLQEQPE
ncbi:MAG: hypothetical protein Q8P63_00990 [Candidatus Nealsonbacteria bacterium]|nr:hypothetical protein [Candidatus Nealsonbacteria bacterium]